MTIAGITDVPPTMNCFAISIFGFASLVALHALHSVITSSVLVSESGAVVSNGGLDNEQPRRSCYVLLLPTTAPSLTT